MRIFESMATLLSIAFLLALAASSLVTALGSKRGRSPRPRGASTPRADHAPGVEWSPERIERTLERDFAGEPIVVVSNREPYVHEKSANGLSVRRPVSGLVTALEPVMRACGGVWVAHGSGSGDREASDARGRVCVPPGEESYLLHRVWLGPEEERGYYDGFANEGLWPLCHIADVRPSFRASDWDAYRRVNRRFADVACAEVDSDDPVVFVQDYHLALVPRMIRERLPRATIVTFWHIPFPQSERFGICPWAEELLRGMLGSSIVGFHTQIHCDAFVDSVGRFLEARVDRHRHAVVAQGHSTLVRPYPISIEWPDRRLPGVPPVHECRARTFGELGLGPNAVLALGVDRLDYTKGLEERLLAVERLLETYPLLRRRFTLVQLLAPSRPRIARYRMLGESLDALAARINTRFARAEGPPIRLLAGPHDAATIFRFYRAADVCYVSSLHDGMNLVAKEFVAARDDEKGVLVLSRMTGAAEELGEALLVSPYDVDQASAALAVAATMPAEEQTHRMRLLREVVAEHNVYRWAGRILYDAARVRRAERGSARFDEALPSGA